MYICVYICKYIVKVERTVNPPTLCFSANRCTKCTTDVHVCLYIYIYDICIYIYMFHQLVSFKTGEHVTCYTCDVQYPLVIENSY